MKWFNGNRQAADRQAGVGRNNTGNVTCQPSRRMPGRRSSTESRWPPIAFPTDLPESDGTQEWDATTLVVADVQAGDQRGLGFGYADTATARLIGEKLAAVVRGSEALAISSVISRLWQSVRNLGRPANRRDGHLDRR